MSAEFDVFAGARKAASLIILRDLAASDTGRPGGIEVLMLRRAERDGDMRSGVAVFPGGVLDARDRAAHAHCVGWDDAQASQRLSLPEGGLDYFVAAARECFEEVGLLFARHAAAAAATVDNNAIANSITNTEETAAPTALDAAVLSQAHALWRGPLQRSEAGAQALCQALGLQFDLRGWHYWSHWLTPPGHPKRFDTRFFITAAPQAQDAEADYGEAAELMWLTPAQALDAAQGLKLLPVTRRTLEELGAFNSVQAALDHAAALHSVSITMPHRAVTAQGDSRIVLPDDPAWAEINRINPSGKGVAHADIVPGRVVALSERVVRVTAPNAGLMTGPGTNSYVLTDPQTRRCTVIDPGPADAVHVQALIAAAPGPIERILVTHTHADHSPGARVLAQATGAPVMGRHPAFAAGQDASFAPHTELWGGEVFELGPQTHLRVVHTPGHASNHLCYELLEEKTLFTGDHVMQGSTVVINPPDGDMAAYFKALQGLLLMDLDWLAPGHGFLVAQPQKLVRALLAHRQAREDLVVAALQPAERLAPAAMHMDDLVARVYADVPVQRHALARRSLLAHLLKLESEGAVRSSAEHWALAR